MFHLCHLDGSKSPVQHLCRFLHFQACSLHSVLPPSLLQSPPEVSTIQPLLCLALASPSRHTALSTADRQEEGIVPRTNVNVISLNIGKLVDMSQGQRTRPETRTQWQTPFAKPLLVFLSTAAGLENVQSPVICEKCSAALSCLVPVPRNVSRNVFLFL